MSPSIAVLTSIKVNIDKKTIISHTHITKRIILIFTEIFGTTETEH